MKPGNTVCIGFSIILFSIAMLVGIEGILLAIAGEPEEYGEALCILWIAAVAILVAGAD